VTSPAYAALALAPVITTAENATASNRFFRTVYPLPGSVDAPFGARAGQPYSARRHFVNALRAPECRGRVHERRRLESGDRARTAAPGSPRRGLPGRRYLPPGAGSHPIRSREPGWDRATSSLARASG
jgi:hypothetical protein